MDILIIFALILINGLFAMSEIAVVSARKIRLQNQANQGKKSAQAALKLTGEPSRFLSTVQIGITLIGIFNGAIGEASLVSKLTPWLAAFSFIGPFAAPKVALLVVVVGITFASLILGELVPKRIAMHYPEVIATAVAYPMIWLSRLTSPFVWVLSFVTEFILRLLGFHNKNSQALTEEDITGILEEGATTGVYEKTEHEIMSRASKLDDKVITTIMTPRNEIHYIDLTRDLSDVLMRIADSPYSRFPVCEGGLDNMVGIVDAGSLFEQTIRGNPIHIRELMHSPQYVPETISAMDSLEIMQQNRVEIAVVVNEYGEVEGVVTLRDIMKVLVGHNLIVNENETDEAVPVQDGNWMVEGAISLDHFRELFKTKLVFPDENEETYHTIAGFIMDHLGYIPKPGESFEWGGFRFEVVMMNRHRIERVYIQQLKSNKG